MTMYAGSFRELNALASPLWAITLGVRPDASKEDIVAAYRKKAMISHPDVAGGNEELTKIINEAKAAAFKDRGFA